MSAYLLDHKEIAMIANAAYHMTCKPRALTELWGNNGAKDFAMALADENIKSVEYRYPGMGACAGMATADYIYKCEVAREVPYAVNRDGAKGMYNLLAKYEYNACEHPEWHDDDANPVKMVINVMLKEAARKMAAHIEEEEEHVADLVKRVEELRGVIAERDEEITGLKNKLTHKNTKIAVHKDIVFRKTETINSLEKRLEDEINAGAEERVKLSKARERVMDLKARVIEMGTKLEAVKIAAEEQLELFA